MSKFDAFALSIDHKYVPTDDNTGLRRLRECWSAAVKAERERCCSIIFGHCDSDNAAQRTVDAIRKWQPAAQPSDRPSTPIGWSDTDWLAYLQTKDPIAWACLDTLYGTSPQGYLRICKPTDGNAFPLYRHPAQPAAQPPGAIYKRGYEEALNDCIRNGTDWARSMFANNAEHIAPSAQPTQEPSGESIRVDGYSCGKCGCVDLVKDDAQPQQERTTLTMGESFLAHILAFWQEQPNASIADTMAQLSRDFLSEQPQQELGDRFMEILRAIHGEVPDAFADSARLAFVQAAKERAQAALAQRKPLSDEQIIAAIMSVADQTALSGHRENALRDFARLIEAAHGIK